MKITQIHAGTDNPYLSLLLLRNMKLDKIPTYSCRHVKKDGEVISVEVYSLRVKYNGRDAIIKIVYDITELISHIDVIQKQNDKLREIAWEQSHIYRAPVARLMGLVNLLTKGLTGKEEESEIHDGIAKTAEELDALITKITQASQEIRI